MKKVSSDIIRKPDTARQWLAALNTSDKLVGFPVEVLNALTAQARAVLRAEEELGSARADAHATRARGLPNGISCAAARMSGGRMFIV